MHPEYENSDQILILNKRELAGENRSFFQRASVLRNRKKMLAFMIHKWTYTNWYVGCNALNHET